MIWGIILYITVGYVFANEHIARLRSLNEPIGVLSFLAPLVMWLPTLLYVLALKRRMN